jgi:hypothetical protein
MDFVDFLALCAAVLGAFALYCLFGRALEKKGVELCTKADRMNMQRMIPKAAQLKRKHPQVFPPCDCMELAFVLTIYAWNHAPDHAPVPFVDDLLKRDTLPRTYLDDLRRAVDELEPVDPIFLEPGPPDEELIGDRPCLTEDEISAISRGTGRLPQERLLHFDRCPGCCEKAIDHFQRWCAKTEDGIKKVWQRVRDRNN